MQTTVAKPKPKPKPAAAKGDASEAKARSSAPAKEAASAEAQRRATGVAAPSGERHQNEGHGRRLTMAFEALEAFPALAESRDRLLSVIAKDHVATADVVSAVESDVALIISILRLANQAQDGRGHVDTAVAAAGRRPWPPRSSAITARRPRARPPSSASPTCSLTTSRARGSIRQRCSSARAPWGSARASSGA